MFEHLFLDGGWSTGDILLTDGFGIPTELYWDKPDRQIPIWTSEAKTARTWNDRVRSGRIWFD
jgi:hypothetical protein